MMRSSGKPKGVEHMRGFKLSVVLASVAVVALAVWAGAYVQETGSHMAVAAERFLASLSNDQATKAKYAFEAPERLDWHFIPRPRKGLPIKELNPEQRALAFGLIQTGTAGSGSLKVTTIMSLEAILRDLEKGSGPIRDPELYYLTFFGTPTNRGRWGWRVEGHHLSLNFVLEDGKIISATPAFFGANPAEVRQGPRQGLRTLADRDDRALRLLQALDDNQKKKAISSSEAPREIRDVAPPHPQPLTTPAEGIAYAEMSGDQRTMLRALFESYAQDMTEEVSGAWLTEINRAGLDSIKFTWAGPADRSSPHAYRVQGPTFLIEFNNTQNGANHIHSVWRNLLGDFGIPLAGR